MLVLLRQSSACCGRLSEAVEGPGGSPEWLVVEVSTEGSNVLEDFLEEISENVGWSGPPPLFALEDT